MRDRFWTLSISAVILIALLLYTVCYTVQEGEYAVIKTLGRIDQVETTPGFGVKWPWPIQTVQPLDKRIRLITVVADEITTRDQKNIHLGLVVGWQVSDPKNFISSLVNEKEATAKIASHLEDARNRVIQRVALTDLVSTAATQSQKFDAFADAILTTANKGLNNQNVPYGVELVSIHIKTLKLPSNTTEKVFDRMTQERNRVSERIIQEGQNEAELIRSRARLERARMIEKAKAEAIAIRGEGEAKAAEYYKVFKENPELANTLRKIDALKATLARRTTVVLPTDILDAILPEAEPKK